MSKGIFSETRVRKKPMAKEMKSQKARRKTWRRKESHLIRECPVQKKSTNTKLTTFLTASGAKNVSKEEGQASRMGPA